jgi:hypothetical protein
MQVDRFNMALNSETADMGVSTFGIFSIICTSVAVHCAQFRVAQRYVFLGMV